MYSPPLFPRTPHYDRTRSPSPNQMSLRPHSSLGLYRGNYQISSNSPSVPSIPATTPRPLSRQETQKMSSHHRIKKGRGFLSPLHVKSVTGENKSNRYDVMNVADDGRVYPGLLSPFR
ncbi:hypothetical protein GEMRC1_011166 [Eukaryota sp. GEM-RC1]